MAALLWLFVVQLSETQIFKYIPSMAASLVGCKYASCA